MAKAQVTISAVNKLPEGLKGAKSELNQFAVYTQQLGNKLKSAFSVAGIVAGVAAAVKGLTDATKECVQQFTEAEKVSKRLAAVWDNVGTATGKSAKELDDYAENLEKVTYFTSESIKEAGLLLAATESLTEEGFDRALQASMDLAAALGEDVTSAASTLAKALEDPEAAFRTLKSIGVTFTDEEKAQIKTLQDANNEFEAQAMILDKIEGKYKGVAQAIADTPSGKLDAIRDTLGDIKETIGEGIVGALEPAFTYILEMLQTIHKWAKDHIDTSTFWENAYAGDSHKLYTDYSKDFIEQRQVEARQDVADQIAMLSDSAWGKFLENAFQQPMEAILMFERDTLAGLMDSYARFSYGDNYESYLGTVEGFMEIIADSYDPLVAVMETISSALDEYKVPAAPAAGTSGAAGSEAAQTLENILGGFVKDYMPKDLAAEYQTVIDTASKYLDMVTQTVPSSLEDMRTLLGLSAEATGADIKKAIEEGGYAEALQAVIATFTDKLSALTPLEELTDSPTLTDLDKILNEYGRQSSSYQLKNLKEQYNRIAQVYEFASEEQRVYLGEILGNIEQQIEGLVNNEENNDPEVVIKSFLDKFSDNMAASLKNLGFGEDQSAAAAGTVLGYAVDSFGEAGELISELAQNMATMGPILGAIVTALKYVFEGLAEVISPILNEFVQYGLEPLRELGRVIGQILLPIMEDIMPLVRESASSLMGVFDTLGKIIGPIISLISSTLTPIIQMLCSSLKILEPVLKVVASRLGGLAGALSWMAQGIRHIMASFVNWLAGISIGNWRPFEGMGMTDPGSPGDFATYISDYLDSINQPWTAGNSIAMDSATQTAVSNAAYRGATQVTINIYAEGPIVGDGGMREFARMIRDEFDALNYYGVTA